MSNLYIATLMSGDLKVTEKLYENCYIHQQ